ncbi:MAG: hypothetical protein EU535_03200 [Promethearchaeota archaeon]|nr:MAG: hypothetical protein EU535_03200 [Candidatus Lokiarchaeota archaeon]
MEIEKKRETSWKIQLDKKDEYIELTSVEISGEVRRIKLALLNKDKSMNINMNKEEFFKFLSLLSTFKDVVIGDESILLESSIKIVQNQVKDLKEYSPIKEDLYTIDPDSTENSIKNKETEELNPEEWDPW